MLFELTGGAAIGILAGIIFFLFALVCFFFLVSLTSFDAVKSAQQKRLRSKDHAKRLLTCI